MNKKLRKSIQIIIVIAPIAVFALIVPWILFGMLLSPIGYSGPGYPSDSSLMDILPIEPTSSGDIPKFVELLREARDSKDISLCDSIPVPQQQTFDFGDYYDKSPSQIAWKTYCKALVTENSSLCHTIDSGHPNLAGECQFVLEEIN